MPGFPVTPGDLDSQWLASALGRDVDGFELEAVQGGFWSTMTRVTTTDGTHVLKFANPSGQSRFICAMFEFARVEIGFYRDAAVHSRIRTPLCHHIAADEDFVDYVIVMEDLGDLRMLDQQRGCPPEEAGWVVDALADLHAGWWNAPGLDSFDWLLEPSDQRRSAKLGELLSIIWEPAFANIPSMPAEIREAGPRLQRALPDLLARLGGQPATLTHGDARLSNMFFGPSDQPEVALVDWQASRRAHGCFDLAYFITQSLTTDVRRQHEDRLLTRYLARLGALGVEAPSRKDVEDAYQLCALYCLTYPIIAASSSASALDPQALEIAERAFTAVLDLDALSVL